MISHAVFMSLSCFSFSGIIHFSPFVDEMIQNTAADDNDCRHDQNPFSSFLWKAAFGIDGGWVKSKGDEQDAYIGGEIR